MARPTQSTRFGETAGGVPDAGLVEPPSGERDTGFQNGNASDATKLSWLLWAIYQWIRYWFEDTHTLHINPSYNGNLMSGTWTRTGYSVKCTSASGTIIFYVPVQDDWTITEVAVQAKGDASADFETFVELVGADPTTTAPADVIGDTITSNPPASWAYYTVAVTDTVISGKALMIQIATTGANLELGNVRIKFKN